MILIELVIAVAFWGGIGAALAGAVLWASGLAGPLAFLVPVGVAALALFWNFLTWWVVRDACRRNLPQI